MPQITADSRSPSGSLTGIAGAMWASASLPLPSLGSAQKPTDCSPSIGRAGKIHPAPRLVRSRAPTKNPLPWGPPHTEAGGAALLGRSGWGPQGETVMLHSKVPRGRTAARALLHPSVKRAAGLGAAIPLTSLIGLPAAAAPQEAVLYAFEGGQSAFPHAGLVMDGNGALYGTTFGALFGSGTVVKLAPPGPGKTGWSKTTLHTFKGGDDGSGPFAGLIMDASGALYAV